MTNPIDRKQHIMYYLKANYDATNDELSTYYAKGKQHLYTSIINMMVRANILYYTGELRKTQHNQYARVFTLVGRKSKTLLESEKSGTNKMNPDFISKTQKVMLLTITHTQAVQIKNYHFNKQNRSLGLSKIQKHRESMVNGEFNPNSMIQFDVNGMLMDGHHRIFAQVEAGVSVTYIVCIGCPVDSIFTIDTGIKRTSTHSIEMIYKERHGLTGFELSLLRNMIMHFKDNVKPQLDKPSNLKDVLITGSGIDNDEIVDVVDEFGEQEMIDAVRVISSCYSAYSDFKDFVASSSIKRVLQCIMTELAYYDPVFTVDFISAVFGKKDDGVFAKVAPNTLKDFIKSSESDLKKKAIDRKLCERQVYNTISHVFNLLKLGVSNKKDIHRFTSTVKDVPCVPTVRV